MATAAGRITILAAALGLTAAAVALPPNPTLSPRAPSTLQGPEVRVGNGTARMFVELGPRGDPRAPGSPRPPCRPPPVPRHKKPPHPLVGKRGGTKGPPGACPGGTINPFSR